MVRPDLEAECTAEDAAARRSLVSVHANLGDALEGAGYVQESGPEQIEVKKAIYRSSMMLLVQMRFSAAALRPTTCRRLRPAFAARVVVSWLIRLIRLT